MMGLRGCRLSILFPGIVEMQVKAILQAAVAVKKTGIEVLPEIMIPLVGHVNELKSVQTQLEAVAKGVIDNSGIALDYMFGTMIEIPRATLIADQRILQSEQEFARHREEYALTQHLAGRLLANLAVDRGAQTERGAVDALGGDTQASDVELLELAPGLHPLGDDAGADADQERRHCRHHAGGARQPVDLQCSGDHRARTGRLRADRPGGPAVEPPDPQQADEDEQARGQGGGEGHPGSA